MYIKVPLRNKSICLHDDNESEDSISNPAQLKVFNDKKIQLIINMTLELLRSIIDFCIA